MKIPDDKPTVFGLTTCPYCRAVRKYLKEKNEDFTYVEIDDLSDEDYESALEIVKKYNPKRSFPTIVFGNSGEAVIGLEKEPIDKALAIMHAKSA